MGGVTEAEPGVAARERRFAQATASAHRLLANIETVIHGKRTEIELVLAALACEGHVLFEDVPGTAKTVLARAIAQSVEEAATTRIQCTPDLQPTDVTGLSIYNQRERDFEFRPGPIFANVVLVDEINRAMPKTQSALLEAMAERQVTVDGVTRELPEPFLLLATENPIEHEGTFPLPEAQLDRFFLKTGLGYPGATTSCASSATSATAIRSVASQTGRRRERDQAAAARRARGLRRRDHPALDRRSRPRDARARAGRDRRIRARVARARARRARVGADPRARLRHSRGRLRAVPARWSDTVWSSRRRSSSRRGSWAGRGRWRSCGGSASSARRGLRRSPPRRSCRSRGRSARPDEPPSRSFRAGA